MGHGIAQIFAVQGYEVFLADINEKILEQGLRNIQNNLALLAENGIVRAEEVEAALGRVKAAKSLEQAVRTAQFVFEAVSENLDIKQNLFEKLDTLCLPDAILATNTSVISITEIAAKAKRRDRIVGTHFWNPPYLIPLVEVVPGRDTSLQTMDAVFDLLKEVGKRPVKLMKDVPGFVGNRLQHALWREAISIVEQGIADAATVDEVVKMSFGARLPVLGPLENADMVGLDLTLQIHDYILAHIECSPLPSPLLVQKVKDNELGFKTGQGFQKWNPEGREQLRRRLLEHLVDWNKKS